MSKVIKSQRLQLGSPKMINSYESGSQVNEDTDIGEALEIEEDMVDPQQVARQAEEIISETEEMVKELLGKARVEAERIIGTARETAEAEVRMAGVKVAEIRDQAYKEGWQIGYTEGIKKAEGDMAGTLQGAQRHLHEAMEERERLIASAEGEIIQLALAVAKKIILEEIEAAPEKIVNVVKKAMEKVRDREEISLRVNPDHLDVVASVKDEIAASVIGIKKMKILGDTAVKPGGCVIETSNGMVDARVERQLEEIEQSVLEVNSNG